MSEFCFTEHCGHGVVEQQLQNDSTKNMCDFVKAILANAGVTGILEISPCPFVAVNSLHPVETDPIDVVMRKMEICDRLGITAFTAVDE